MTISFLTKGSRLPWGRSEKYHRDQMKIILILVQVPGNAIVSDVHMFSCCLPLAPLLSGLPSLTVPNQTELALPLYLIHYCIITFITLYNYVCTYLSPYEIIGSLQAKIMSL